MYRFRRLYSPAQEPPYPDITDATIKDNPVVGVTWKQAGAYCGWMDARLPTEAEWEKAARGENGNVYPWGNDKPSCDKANFKGCKGGTTSVTSFPGGASSYGAYDMAGNVYEWVNDWFQDQPSSSATNDPQGPATGTQRVIKSSSYKSTADLLPASSRFSLEPGKYRQDLGFRCVVQNPQGFAPFCQTSGISGSTSGCQAPKPGISTTPFCENRGSNTGGVNIRITVDPNTSPDLVLNNDTGPVHCTSFPRGDSASTHLITCTGPENTTFGLRAYTYCPAPGPFETYHLQCPAGYSIYPPNNLISDGYCYYVAGSPGTSGTCADGSAPNADGQCVQIGGPTTNCPSGFSYNASQSCCSQSGGVSTTPLSACAPGYVFYSALGCIKADETEWDVTATLGSCKTVGGGSSGNNGGSLCPSGKTYSCNFSVAPPVCSCK